MNSEEYLKQLYLNRFNEKQRIEKLALWKVLIADFLQKHVDPKSIVLDIGGGYCEFINQIQAKEKYLIDLNPDSKKLANPDVKVLHIDILKDDFKTEIPDNHFDVIFTSNFFEHLQTKENLIEILAFCFESLKPGGSMLVIQPNFKYSFREYYDFIDHQLPITHLALQEVMQTIGFSVNTMIPRFLPFSTRSVYTSPALLRIYLKLPFLWSFFGGQMFINASKP